MQDRYYQSDIDNRIVKFVLKVFYPGYPFHLGYPDSDKSGFREEFQSIGLRNINS